MYKTIKSGVRKVTYTGLFLLSLGLGCSKDDGLQSILENYEYIARDSSEAITSFYSDTAGVIKYKVKFFFKDSKPWWMYVDEYKKGATKKSKLNDFDIKKRAYTYFDGLGNPRSKQEFVSIFDEEKDRETEVQRDYIWHLVKEKR